MIKDATFSEDRIHRYALTRQWDDQGEMVMFIGLNPSTADETLDDPTVRRCIGFARDWGYGGLFMLNIFGFRSTNPKALALADDPVGSWNNRAISDFASESDLIIAAWGVHGALYERGKDVREQLRYQGHGHKLHHLGLTREHHPKHPLYLPKTSMPVPWN